jgi:hypothetical protein
MYCDGEDISQQKVKYDPGCYGFINQDGTLKCSGIRPTPVPSHAPTQKPTHPPTPPPPTPEATAEASEHYVFSWVSPDEEAAEEQAEEQAAEQAEEEAEEEQAKNEAEEAAAVAATPALVPLPAPLPVAAEEAAAVTPAPTKATPAPTKATPAPTEPPTKAPLVTVTGAATISGFTTQTFNSDYQDAYELVLVNDLQCQQSQLTIQVADTRRRLGSGVQTASSITVTHTASGLNTKQADHANAATAAMVADGGKGLQTSFAKEIKLFDLKVPFGYGVVVVEAEPEEKATVPVLLIGAVLGAAIIVALLVLAFKRFNAQRVAAANATASSAAMQTPSKAIVKYDEFNSVTTPMAAAPSTEKSAPRNNPKTVKCPGEVPRSVAAGMAVFAETKTGFSEAVVVKAKAPTPNTPGGTGLDSLWTVKFTTGTNLGEELTRKQSRLRSIKVLDASHDEAVAHQQSFAHEGTLHPESSGCLESCFWATIGAGVSNEEKFRMFQEGQRGSIDSLLQVRLDGKTHTGNGFCFDIVYYLQNDEMIWGMFAAQKHHPYSRRERKFVVLSMVFVAMFLSSGMTPPTNCKAFLYSDEHASDAMNAAILAEHTFPNLDLFGWKTAACESGDAAAQANVGALLVAGATIIVGALLTQLAFCFCLAQYAGGIKDKTDQTGVYALAFAVLLCTFLGAIGCAALGMAESVQRFALGYFMLKAVGAAWIVSLCKELLTFFALYVCENVSHHKLEDPHAKLAAFDDDESAANLSPNEMFAKMKHAEKKSKRNGSVSPPRLIHGALL